MRFSRKLENIASKISPHIRGQVTLKIVQFLAKYRAFRFLTKAFDPNEIRKKLPVILKENLHNIELQNAILRADLNDHIGYRIFITKSAFDSTAIEIAKKIGLSKNDIYLDIGANIGSVCVPLSRCLGCECIAVEASNRNASILLHNLYQNKIRSTTWIRALVAPDHKDRYIELYTRDGNTGANSIKTGWNPSVTDSAPEIVRTATLDDLITDQEMQRIKLVKIDVEGAEEDVLRGASRLLDHAECPIVLEYRIDATNKYLNSNYDGLLEILSKKFNIFSLNKNFTISKFDKNKSYENIIAIPQKFDISILK